VLDSYHAITPVRVDICPPALISTKVSIFFLVVMHGRKTTFFVESSDSDIRKLVGIVVSEITKKTRKYEPES